MDAKNEATEMYATMRMLRDDMPDGMWNDIRDLEIPARCREARELSQEPAWEMFIEEMREVCEEWGFSI